MSVHKFVTSKKSMARMRNGMALDNFTKPIQI